MTVLRLFLLTSTLIIFAITIYVAMKQGINWPSIFFGDIANLNWRSQFNVDFLIHLTLFATWILWREGYLLITYQANGDVKKMLLGTHEKLIA